MSKSVPRLSVARRLWIVASLGLFVAWVSSGGVASAQCGPGTSGCGAAHCTPDGGVCCASVGHEELSCPGGTVCKADTTCGTADPVCGAGQTVTLADCGGDTCGCSAACRSGKDCASGCCSTAGFCAPACVCNQPGQLYLNCAKSGLGFAGLAKSGCSVGGAGVADGGEVLLLVASLMLLAIRRRRLR